MPPSSEDRTVHRAPLLHDMGRVRGRDDFTRAVGLAERYLRHNPRDAEVGKALEELREREERRMLLTWYAPCFLIVYLLIGYVSGRWGVSVVAAVVVAMPVHLIVWAVFSGLRKLIRG